MNRTIARLIVLAIIVVALVRPAYAERQMVDRVVALVEDEAIFLSDIQAVIRQIMFQQQKRELTAQEQQDMSTKVLQDLINDKLVIAQAQRLGVDVTFADVEEQVTKAIDENRQQLGEDVFEDQLAREGFTIDELKKMYRQQIRNRMLVEQVLQMEMSRDNRPISEADLREYFDSKPAEALFRPEVVRLRTILIALTSSDNAEQLIKSRLEELRKRIIAGEEFAELAKANSQDPSAPQGGDLGFLKPEDLRDESFRGAIEKLAVGEVSDPVRTEYGYHLIKIVAKREASGEVRIRHLLMRVEAGDADVQASFTRTNEIHSQLEAGGDFDKIADELSEDPTAGVGGDLGWLKVVELPEFFQDVLKEMKEGDISQVLREAAGFRIVKLVSREAARTYQYEEVKEDLRRMYQQEKMSVTYADYIAGLRLKFGVDLKAPVN